MVVLPTTVKHFDWASEQSSGVSVAAVILFSGIIGDLALPSKKACL